MRSVREWVGVAEIGVDTAQAKALCHKRNVVDPAFNERRRSNNLSIDPDSLLVTANRIAIPLVSTTTFAIIQCVCSRPSSAAAAALLALCGALTSDAQQSCPATYQWQVIIKYWRSWEVSVSRIDPGNGRAQLSYVMAGGSFGVVYKAIERTTGDIVAIKLVSFICKPTCCSWASRLLTCRRLISSRATMTFKRFNRKYRFSVPAPVPLSPNTAPAFSEDTSYG